MEVRCSMAELVAAGIPVVSHLSHPLSPREAARGRPYGDHVGEHDCVWHPRKDPTPAGTPVWASDGQTVWLIHGDGKPIPDHAVLVKYWSVALIPRPYGGGSDNSVKMLEDSRPRSAG